MPPVNCPWSGRFSHALPYVRSTTCYCYNIGMELYVLADEPERLRGNPGFASCRRGRLTISSHLDPVSTKLVP